MSKFSNDSQDPPNVHEEFISDVQDIVFDRQTDKQATADIGEDKKKPKTSILR